MAVTPHKVDVVAHTHSGPGPDPQTLLATEKVPVLKPGPSLTQLQKAEVMPAGTAPGQTVVTALLS